MLPAARMEALIARHAEIEAELAKGGGGDNFAKLSREFAELSPVIDDVKALKQAQTDLAGAEALIAGSDRELAGMAADEKRELETRIEELEHKLRLALIPKDAADARDAILEVRAGTGGDEASLFAGDLFRMYERYAALQGWTVELLSANEGTAGGFKE
ncbi:MAG TPA: PCRF domain-containing protein, partial [Xanthobacteraceae bacterium]|nr:PCRF domain-containing protein [Xanthobacteraceae bacterium]